MSTAVTDDGSSRKNKDGKYKKVVVGGRAPVHFKFAQAIRNSASNLRKGKVLCLDPGSSKFGWAIYDAGVLVASGAGQTTGRHLQQRLRSQVQWMADTFDGMHFDIMILEQPYAPSASTIPSLYIKVMKSIGLFQALVPYDYLLDIRPSTWQSYAGSDWVKGDESDAIEMGKAVFRILDAVTGEGSSSGEITEDTEEDEGAKSMAVNS